MNKKKKNKKKLITKKFHNNLKRWKNKPDSTQNELRYLLSFSQYGTRTDVWYSGKINLNQPFR